MKNRELAIVGVGLHPWGVFPDKTMPEMGVDAIMEALADANMSWREIETMACGAYMFTADKAGVPAMLMGTFIEQIMGSTGIPVANVVNACATGQSIIREACLAVASGEYDVALAVAADKSSGGFFRPQSRDPFLDQDYVRYVMTGETNPAYWAMEMKRRMHEAGTTEEDMAMVKVITSKAGALNPKARYYPKTYTLEQVLASPMVCDPFRLFEICATSDGAAAIIITSLDKAKKYTSKPILIDAVNVGTPSFGDPTIPLLYLSSYPQPGVLPLSESRNGIAGVYRMSGRKPEDIDVIELPDNSPWHYFAYLDIILGLQLGEAENMLRKGDTDPIDGKLPVCPSGGISSTGEAVVAQGMYQVYELVKQLRGEAGDRQVKKDLKVGLAQTYGYAGNNAACIVSKAW